MGVRVDLLQPDLWLLNGMDIVDCSVLQSYYDMHSDASINSISYSSKEWAASMCHLAGAYTPVEVGTTVVSSKTSTFTSTIAIPASSPASSVAYPNGIFADGVVLSSNFSLGTTSNNRIDLDDFQFFLASETNMYAGGLGLSRHPQNLGVLDTLKDQGRILASGYSLFLTGYSNQNTSAGELLLGAVDQKYYTGSFYLFPLISYEGWQSLDSFSPLPIMVLERLFLENIDTNQKVTLSSAAVPLVLDTRLSYSFLPLEIVINLAIQTNAYYNSQYQRWLVRCLDITGSNATMHFQFGPLDISIPLTALIYDAYYGDNYLYFSSGVRACFLNVMPDTSLGYSSLGLPFLSHVYLAMDNEAGNVALAAGNPEELIDPQDFIFSQSPSALPSFKASLVANNSIEATRTTIAYIESGFIPFATSANYSSLGFTMTFFSANSSKGGTIPGIFTVATILSGEVYVTGSDGSTISGSKASASAANAQTPMSQGISVKSYIVSREASYLPYVLLLSSILMILVMS